METKIYSEKLYNFYSSPNIIRVIQLRKVKWAGCVVYMEKYMPTKF